MYRFAVLALLMLVVGAAPSAVPVSAPSPSATEHIARSTALLLTTFYRKLDPHVILTAEHDALLTYARTHGAAHATLPKLPSAVDAAHASEVATAQFAALPNVASINRDAAASAAIKAMAAATHDRWTAFFTPSEYKSFDEILDPAKLSGIGILMDNDPAGYVRAYFVLPDTPADRGGIRTGDVLESIDGHSTKGWSIADARRHLLGAAGTPVAITVRHVSDDSTSDVSLVRAEVQPPTVYFTMLPDNVAYLYIIAFGDATAHEFQTAVARSERAGARAYVLDLRNDGGGLVGAALSVSSQFIPTGPIVSIESNAGEIETFEADNTAIAAKPLAVLVNAYTASASEITAAAIQESGTGVLIGTKTFGKGVVQSVNRFADGSAIKITTGRYFTPLNHDINGRGIVPNVIANENAKAVFGIPGKDAQLERAIAILHERLARAPGTGKPE